MFWKVEKLEDWNNVAVEILKHFPERKIFVLNGEMGVGKTTLVKSFCKALGVTEEAVSPTFYLVNEYAGSQKIFHFDLYSLKNAEELLAIGFEEYLADGAFCFIEWPELAEPFLPNDFVKLWLEWDGEGRIVRSENQ